MKRITAILLFLGFQLLTFKVWSQPGYEVVEAPHWLNKEFVNAYTINLIGSTPDNTSHLSPKLLCQAPRNERIIKKLFKCCTK